MEKSNFDTLQYLWRNFNQWLVPDQGQPHIREFTRFFPTSSIMELILGGDFGTRLAVVCLQDVSAPP